MNSQCLASCSRVRGRMDSSVAAFSRIQVEFFYAVPPSQHGMERETGTSSSSIGEDKSLIVNPN